MNIAAFKESLAKIHPPDNMIQPLLALWYEAKGDWHKAHEIAKEIDNTTLGALIHAYLHRKKGEHTNASYWYQQTGNKVYSKSFEEEWHMLFESCTQ